MRNGERYWKFMSVILVISLFYIGAGMRQDEGDDALPIPDLARSAHGQVYVPAITPDGLDTLITHSDDGRTLYIWTFEKWDQDHERLPLFRGIVTADEE